MTSPLDPSPPGEASKTPSRKRRWGRRILWTLGILLLLLVLLVLFLPAILSSPPLERLYQKQARKYLGRDVVVGDVRLGWTKSIRLQRLLIPAVPGEGDYPLLDLQDAEVDLTLWQIVKLPPYDVVLTVGAMESNAVRDEAGALNFVKMSEHLKAQLPPKKDEPPPPPEDKGPSPLPLQSLRIKIEDINARFVDFSTTDTLVAGWERGLLAAEWPGPGAGLTADTGGDLRLNTESLPWDARVKLEDWVNAERFLTTDTLTLTASTGGMMGPHQLTGGGLFARVTTRPEQENTVRILVPLEPFYQFLRGFPARQYLPADAQLPTALAGTLDLRADATHARAFTAWDANLALRAEGLATVGGPTGGQRLALPPLSLDLDTHVDTAAKDLEHLTLALESTILDASANVRGLNWANPTSAAQAHAALALDIGAGWMLAANVLGAPQDEPPLPGTVRLAAELLPPSGEALRAALEATGEFGTLTSLQPFVEQADFLASGPMNLQPLNFDTSGVLAFDPAARTVQVTGLEWTGAYTDATLAAAVDLDAPMATWSVELAGATDLTPLLSWDVVSRFFPPTLEEVSGQTRYHLAARALAETAVQTSGVLAWTSATLALAERGAVLDGAPLAMEWDLDARWGAPTPSVLIRTAVLESPFANATVEGEASAATVDLQGVATADLEPILELTRVFVPAIRVDVGGSLRAEFSAQGTLNQVVQARLSAETGRPLRYLQPGLLDFEVPIAADLATEIGWRGEEMAWVGFDLSRFEFGDALVGTARGRADLIGGHGLDMTAHAVSETSAVLALLEEGYLETNFTTSLALEGPIEATVAIDTPFRMVDGVLLYDEPWNIEGESNVALAYVEWAFGEMAGVLAEFSDARTFSVRVPDPNIPSIFEYRDTAQTTLGVMDGPLGAALANASLDAEVFFSRTDPILYHVRDGSFESLSYANETVAVALPPTTFRIETVTDQDAGTFTFRDAVLTIAEGALEAAAEGTTHMETTATTLEAVASVGDLGAWTRIVTMRDEALSALVSDLAGSATLTTALQTYPIPENPTWFHGWPVTGQMRLQIDQIGARTDPTYAVEGLGGVMLFDAPNTATMLLAADIELASVAGGAMQPLETLVFRGEMGVQELDVARVQLETFAIESIGTRARANFLVEDLLEFFRSAETDPDEPALVRALETLTVRSEMVARQDLARLDGLMEQLSADGSLTFGATAASTPGNRLAVTSTFTARNASLAWGDMATIRSMNGTLPVEKTVLLTPQARPAVPPQTGTLRLSGIDYDVAGFSGAIGETVLTLRGIQNALDFEAATVNFLGGPATTTWRLEEIRNDPVITGHASVTGLNGGNLVPRGTVSGSRGEEINAVASLRWRFPPDPGAALLDNLNVVIQSVRIGRGALQQILRALDANQDDPRFQNAVVALNLGSPTDMEMRLENGLLTARTDLRLTTGGRVELPILDRAPLSELVNVYDFTQQAQLLALTRVGLKLLLATDLATIRTAIDDFSAQEGALP